MLGKEGFGMRKVGVNKISRRRQEGVNKGFGKKDLSEWGNGDECYKQVHG
jgi:hypothetical protein